MNEVHRKITYRLYPSKTQAKRLEEMLTLHRHLYNAALEQRLLAYKTRKISLSFADQCLELTKLRAEDKAYEALNAQSEQVTLKRLQEAFQHFFRRLKENQEKAGFPRFKSIDRFHSFGYKSYGDGWKFESKKPFINGKLKLSSVGLIQARGRGRYQDKERSTRFPGTPKTLQVMKKQEKWYASVTYETEKPYREHGEEAIAFDWGVKIFLTVVNEDKKVHTVENPRFIKKSEARLKKAQQRLSKKKKGSKNRLKAKRRVVRLHQKIANQRLDFLHQTTSFLVKQAKAIGTEELSVQAMTAHGGRHKAGLNQAILDTAIGEFLSLLEYKAEEAGIPLVLANTRKLKPTQTCSDCGHQEKKTLSERVHHCKHCGFTADRDVNAALVILSFLLAFLKRGREPALCVEKEVVPELCRRDIPSTNHETPTIASA